MNQTKSSHRGGRRPGAGRKKSALTIRTRAMAEQLIISGLTPLESMIKLMRSPQPVRQKMESQAKYDQRVYQWREFTLNAAAKAAPYIHPRLQAIEHTGKDGAPPSVNINVEFI